MTPYPKYVQKPEPKPSIIETWFESVPSGNKNTLFIVMGVIFGLVIIAIFVAFFAFKGRNNCKDAFCKVVESVKTKINSKVIVK